MSTGDQPVEGAAERKAQDRLTQSVGTTLSKQEKQSGVRWPGWVRRLRAGRPPAAQ
jgi:hypothetical protein